jgi:hypothetical protein
MLKIERKQLRRWLPVCGFESLYKISNLGEIKSLRPPFKLLKMSGPYCNVCLTALDGSYHTFSMHRLIARHFLPNPHKFPMVLHKDGDKKNNKTSNLYWGTQLENMQDRSKHMQLGITRSWKTKIYFI